MQDVQAPDLSHWWYDDELELCPRCANKQLTPPSPSMIGMRVCLTCGIVDENGAQRPFTSVQVAVAEAAPAESHSSR